MSSSSEFPSTLKEFGYGFNDVGQLRKLDPTDGSLTDKPFEFEVTTDAKKNQAHFEALGDVITEHMYQMLVDMGLHKIPVPSPETSTSSFVFGTKTDFKDTKKLLILIHGYVVRAGQWCRSLIIRESIDHGSQIPYIKRAIDLGYDVLVTNTNHNSRIEDDKRIELEGHESPEAHLVTVWENLIKPAYDSIESFAVVAHSYGGIVLLNMTRDYPDAFLNKCFAVGFIESVHYAKWQSDEMLKWFKKHARTFVTSEKPLGTAMNYQSTDILCFSAGHDQYDWAMWACMDVLFQFLEERYQKFLNPEEETTEEAENALTNGKDEEEEEEGKEEKAEEVQEDGKAENGE